MDNREKDVQVYYSSDAISYPTSVFPFVYLQLHLYSRTTGASLAGGISTVTRASKNSIARPNLIFSPASPPVKCKRGWVALDVRILLYPNPYLVMVFYRFVTYFSLRVEFSHFHRMYGINIVRTFHIVLIFFTKEFNILAFFTFFAVIIRGEDCSCHCQ